MYVMARPRKYTFPLSDLEGFEEIRLELESKPELDDFDIENAVITLKQRKQSYTAQPENLKNALASLDIVAYEYVLYYLNHMNITEETLFGGLEGFSKSLVRHIVSNI